MKDTVAKNGWHLVEFNSISEFLVYIEKTPTNNAFLGFDKRNCLSSKRLDRKSSPWSGTQTYEEAFELLRSGWTIGAKNLEIKLKKVSKISGTDMKVKNFADVCGYQAIVPLYLQGVPCNMVNRKMVPMKQKVITINRVVSCSASVRSETLENENIKCFQIIRKLEQSGYRVNLNLLMSSGHACVKIKLKSAGEKLNISKLAFPLVHPAMLRRMFFRFIETYPTYPGSYTFGYGEIPNEEEFRKVCGEKEILLPTLLKGKTEEEIVKLSVDELLEKLK